MKRLNKNIHIIFVIALVIILGSCKMNNPNNKGFLLDNGKNYEVYITDDYLYNYYIYKNNKEIAYSEINIQQPVTITEYDDLIKISKDYGTGLQVIAFFDITNNLLSKNYSYVFANTRNMVAYIDVVDMNNRKIVVENIFNDDILYEEPMYDFAKIDTPIIWASFSSDKVLQISYESSKDVVVDRTIQIE
ncbi:MAG: hypothetical protein IJK26_04565 [Clostridia bacterium]|nr:hypothetical protein [Clostridia bacterium]